MTTLTQEPEPTRRIALQRIDSLTREEVSVITLSSNADEAARNTRRSVYYISILVLILQLLPDKAEISFEIVGVKFEKIVGQKEFIPLMTAILLFRFSDELFDALFFSQGFDASLKLDFDEENLSS